MGDSNIILNHVLVPKHKALSEAESKRFLKKTGLTKDRIPKIREDDPVIVAIGARHGQIVRITRQSSTAGEAEYYRIVI